MLFGENPANSAMPYLNQTRDMLKPYFDPYINQGQQAYGNVAQLMNQGQQAYGNFDRLMNRGENAYNAMNPGLTEMATDPTAFLEALMQHYQPSGGYQLKLDEMSKAAGNTAAAGGMRGSLNDIKDQSRLTEMLMSDDMQQWLQNVLGIQGAGMSGLNSFYNAGNNAAGQIYNTGNNAAGQIYNTGYDATKSLSSDLSNILGTQAQLSFQGQRENNQQKNDLFSGLLSGVGGLLGGFF
jgi:hypothetical protein